MGHAQDAGRVLGRRRGRRRSGHGRIHIGTDGGGSIRIPASFTGCYGLKPTRARVPAWPASPLGTLAHVGPLTRSVADAALAVTIMAAPDARDVYAWTSPAPDVRIGLDDGIAGLRIAYSPRLGYAKRVDPEVATAVTAAVRLLEQLGAHVEETDPDLGGDPVAAWDTLWWSSAATILQPFGERVRRWRPRHGRRRGAGAQDDGDRLYSRAAQARGAA